MTMPEFKFALRDDLKDNPEFLPTRAYNTDTGWDVKCAEPDGVTIIPGQYIMIKLGFRVYSPPGWWLELRPRSSTFIKKHLHALYGVLDETWEGECAFCCQFSDPNYYGSIKIPFGERIGQIIPIKRQEMIVTGVSNEEIERLFLERNAARGAQGFGSTG